MKRKPFFILLSALFLASLLSYLYTTPRDHGVVLIGIVDGNEVIVSPQLAGRLARLNVDEGTGVEAGQVLAELDTAELQAQLEGATATQRSLAAEIAEAEARLSWTDASTAAALDKAQANLAASRAQLEEAQAELRRAQLDNERATQLFQEGVYSAQQRDRALADYQAAQARVAAFADQVKAADAALTAARADRQQVEVLRKQLASTRARLEEAQAQTAEAETRLGYATLRAPLEGIVSVRAARQGEVVQIGQAIVTLIDIDHLWVRAVVPETYVNRIRLGDRFPVRLPDGQQVEGEVFFKGVESDFATQRDVSRSKRDIKAFALKLAIPNLERRLYVGMTAEVLLSFKD